MKDETPFIKSTIANWIMAILTMFSIGWGIYQTYHVKNPRLQYEIVSQVELFNKTNDLSKITLLLDTIDVLKENLNIAYYVIKVQNVGNQHLRAGDYDEGVFGIAVNDGIIIQEINLVDASTQHISDRYKELQSSFTKDFVNIPRISLDRNDWYSISIAVIHDDSASPTLIPVGKIIGQKKIIVTTASNDSEHLSFSEKLFKGGIWINLARAVIFLIIWIVIIMVIGTTILNRIANRENKKDENIYNGIVHDTSIPGFVKDDYKKNQEVNIVKASYYYKMKPERLNEEYKKIEQLLSTVNDINYEEIDEQIITYKDIKKLIELGYLQKDDNGAIVAPANLKKTIFKVENILTENNRAGKYSEGIKHT